MRRSVKYTTPRNESKLQGILSLTVTKKQGIYWITEKKTGRIVSWCLNRPTKFMLDTMSRASGWQHKVKASVEEFGTYKGTRK